MRVVLVTASDISLPQAPSVTLRFLVHELARRGAAVEVWAPHPAATPDRRWDETGMRLRGVRVPGWRGLGRGLLQVAFVAMLVREKLAGRPFVLWVRHTTSMLLVVPAARLLGIPCLVRLDGLSGDFQSRRSRLRHAAGVAAEWINCRYAGMLAAVSGGIRQGVIARYGLDPARVTVLTNGVDLAGFLPRPRPECVRALGLDPARQYLLFAGSLCWWQGVEFALEALGGYLRAHPGVVLLIVGDGPQRAEIERTVRRLGLDLSVRLAGWVDHGRIADYIGAARLCLLPKRPIESEYSPVKLYEYWACARPVVASRLPGLEVVESIGGGKLFDWSDARALERAVSELLAHADRAQAMGENGRRLVLDGHGWDAIGGRLYELLEDMASGGKRD